VLRSNTAKLVLSRSIYLKQIAQIQILAQIGCYVPAQYALVRITDQIFTRLSVDDCPEENIGTFRTDCDEVNYIVANATENSLVLLDEVGRGTSPDEGAGMCYALCEHLALKCRAFTVLATHFHELTRLCQYPTIKAKHMEVLSTSVGIKYTHKLRDGPLDRTNHHGGLTLARATVLPDSMVARATQLCHVLDTAECEHQWRAESDVARERLRHQLSARLRDLSEKAGNLDPSTVVTMLQHIQREHAQLVAPFILCEGAVDKFDGAVIDMDIPEEAATADMDDMVSK
jgi:DNA mismatch repair protein MSH4